MRLRKSDCDHSVHLGCVGDLDSVRARRQERRSYARHWQSLGGHRYSWGDDQC